MSSDSSSDTPKSFSPIVRSSQTVLDESTETVLSPTKLFYNKPDFKVVPENIIKVKSKEKQRNYVPEIIVDELEVMANVLSVLRKYSSDSNPGNTDLNHKIQIKYNIGEISLNNGTNLTKEFSDEHKNITFNKITESIERDHMFYDKHHDKNFKLYDPLVHMSSSFLSEEDNTKSSFCNSLNVIGESNPETDERVNQYLQILPKNVLQNLIYSKTKLSLMTPSEEQITFSSERAESQRLVDEPSEVSSVSEMSYNICHQTTRNTITQMRESKIPNLHYNFSGQSLVSDQEIPVDELCERIFMVLINAECDDILMCITIPYSMLRAIRLTRTKKLNKSFQSGITLVPLLKMKSNQYLNLSLRLKYHCAKELMQDMDLFFRRIKSAESTVGNSEKIIMNEIKTNRNLAVINSHHLPKTKDYTQSLVVPIMRWLNANKRSA